MSRLVWVFAAVAVFSACPPKRIDFGPRGEIDDPEALLKLVDETEAKVFALDGDAKVRVNTPEAKGAFTMYTALSRPALVHLEPLDFFGKPQAVLVVNGDTFGLYQAQDNRYYTGPASPENVSRFLPITVPAPELVQIMLGDVPRIPHERLELTSDEKCACYVVTLHRGEVTQTLQVHPRSFRVLRSEVRGAPAYDLLLEDYGEFGTVSFPRRIKLTAADAKVELDLRYENVTLNKAPDLTMFEVAAPEGIEVVEVDPQGRPTSGDAPPPSGPVLTPEPSGTEAQ